MHYWARGWPLCSLEERANRSSVSRELHAYVCAAQAWNTLFRAGVAFSSSVSLFIRSLQNLEGRIPSFETPQKSLKAASASRDQSEKERANISKVSLKIPAQLNITDWLGALPEMDEMKPLPD